MDLPRVVYVYIDDYDGDGEAVFIVATNVDDIPEDIADSLVGTYELMEENVLHVQKELV